ncbi:hypothetical protein [Hymenobacter sp. PAMC 26628]|uniref:hypothetical protein n=1 Tax=Hymenobacter sp. PAMC 26628 TaxID=1484118 RepID=UPI0007704CAE|nr:hypothetical protein [Hymenobacter sp. PAMC 26628]AMJ65051.1 hypothetical protein AXW84_06120 [Hymenobacter sp. PAMC 26628]
MNKVQIGGVRRQLPANWGELTRPQLLLAVPILFQALPPVRAKMLLLRTLLGLPRGLWRGLNSFQVADLLQLVRWLTEPSGLTRQLLPVLGPWWARCAGPGDWLAGVSVWEFANAEHQLRKWVASQAEADLNHLAAVLYRPRRWGHGLRTFSPGYTGDDRQAFNPKTVGARAARVAHWPLAHRQAVLLYYLGCRAALERAYPHLFSGDAGNAKDPNPWLTLIGRLPNDKFGDIEQIGKRPLHTVLLFTNQFIRDAPKDPK